MSEANALPDRFSELIRVAIADAGKLDRSIYRPYAYQWHRPVTSNPQHRCNVCTAGAVIAGTLDADPSEDWFPGMFDQDTEAKLNALDGLRDGSLSCGAELGVPALDTLGVTRAQMDTLRALSGYSDWCGFDAHLGALDSVADTLHAAGY